jgi:hypothetical protein
VARDESESVFVTRDKLRVLGTADQNLTGLRSLHVDHIGNAWG